MLVYLGALLLHWMYLMDWQVVPGAWCLVPHACPVPAASHTRIMHYYAELVSVLLFLLSFALRRCLAWLGS